ncbi:nucleotide-binding protein [Sinorhizobium terangae]|uniref:nucleotide-binding protein n=1 Tax=Sinorhizobium terangae TaxID=110322 RepID=UPI0024B16AA4|nr:nucleotide-binding protein [Sinorhizobium terangae]WFU47727.1 nucleotide-binding protein [Sinorhizobium terangae]
MLIAYTDSEWDGLDWDIERSRVAIEYTADAVSERYRDLDEAAVTELKSFPCLFAVEHEVVPTRIGYLTDVAVSDDRVTIGFEFDANLPPLPSGALENMRSEIELGKLELYRTHWAVKDQPLWEILISKGYLTAEQVNAALNARSPTPTTTSVEDPNQPETGAPPREVFIVHGQDEIAKLDAANFIQSLGLVPIILHQQASLGMTIIEKIEHYTNVGYGIVLYTECDEGRRRGELNSRYRARQNVVFEHGYLIARLGRKRVAAMVKGHVETPNDISGVVYVSMDDSGSWKDTIRLELKQAGYAV